MCCLLVSGFFTEVTQQIHSLRASGVISSHFSRAAESEIRTLRKSAGTACTAPGETAFLPMDFILHGYAIGFGELTHYYNRMKSPSEVYRCSIDCESLWVVLADKPIPASSRVRRLPFSTIFQLPIAQNLASAASSSCYGRVAGKYARYRHLGHQIC